MGGPSASLAVTDRGNNRLLMVGYPLEAWPWARTDYFSKDDGATWSSGRESQLPETTAKDGSYSVRCSRSLAQDERTVLFSAEPSGPGRHNMTLQCSMDSGETWRRSLPVDGNKYCGFSGLALAKEELLLLACED